MEYGSPVDGPCQLHLVGFMSTLSHSKGAYLAFVEKVLGQGYKEVWLERLEELILLSSSSRTS